ncbi:MAG: aldo/keto reductase [Thermodesulfobacteriota bacterium]
MEKDGCCGKDHEIPQRRLGATGEFVSILGLGGEGILRTWGEEKKAAELINGAIDMGVNYMESARAYEGSESYFGKALGPRRGEVFLAGKSHARDYAGAMDHLHETLKNMGTDYLDLWQVHDVRTSDDVEAIFAPGGAYEAFTEVREKGLVRFIGVTGHHDPTVLARCVREYDFDTVLMPVNPAEPAYKPFVEEVVPEASAKDMGIIAMKVYLRGGLNAPKRLLFCYALTQPVSTAVIGCDSIEQLKENVEIASSFIPLRLKEVERFTEFISSQARQLMYYKP